MKLLQVLTLAVLLLSLVSCKKEALEEPAADMASGEAPVPALEAAPQDAGEAAPSDTPRSSAPPQVYWERLDDLNRVVFLLLVGLVIAAVVLALRWLRRRGRRITIGGPPPTLPPDDGPAVR